VVISFFPILWWFMVRSRGSTCLGHIVGSGLLVRVVYALIVFQSVVDFGIGWILSSQLQSGFLEWISIWLNGRVIVVVALVL
jgi:hypothetical protein